MVLTTSQVSGMNGFRVLRKMKNKFADDHIEANVLNKYK